MKIWLGHLDVDNSTISFKRTSWEVLCDSLFKEGISDTVLYSEEETSALYTLTRMHQISTTLSLTKSTSQPI